MALDNEIVCEWESEGINGVLNIPGNGEPFDDTKEEYTLKITVSNSAGQTKSKTYKVTNTLEHLPALCVEGNYTGDGLNGWCYFPHASFGGPAMNPFMRLHNISSNITFVEDSSEGIADYDISIRPIAGVDNIFIEYQTEYVNESCAIQIEADFPLFMGTRNEYSNPSVDIIRYVYDAAVQGVYISEIALAGDETNIDEAINGFEVVDTIPENVTYYISNWLKKNGSQVTSETKMNRFQIPPGARIWLVDPGHDDGGQTTNMKLYMRGLGLPPTFKYKERTDATWQIGHILTSSLTDYYRGTWTNHGNGDFYVAIVNTNIPIFTNETQGDQYGDGLIGEDQAINAGQLENHDPTTGESEDATNLPVPSVSVTGIGFNVWALAGYQIESVMDKLFDDDQTIIDSIKAGVWLWGNNPIDFIVSCYWVPFDVDNFYKTQTKRLYLGQYDTGHDYERVSERLDSGNRILLVSTTIDSVYGDWRDICNFKYEIYLPYIGFYPLDINQYIDKYLTIEMAFDVLTHNVRYYLFANGKLIDRVDGSVGIDIPLMGTDMVNKYKSDMSGFTNIVKGGFEAGGGAISGNIKGFASGALDVASGYAQMKKYPREQIVGSISSSMNIYDINYVYLKITEKNSLKPDRLNELYNYPSYYMGSVSSLSGYCEIADIRFNSTATDAEIEEIRTLLRGGVIF